MELGKCSKKKIRRLARHQSAHYRAVCAGPKTKKHHTNPRGPRDNSYRSSRNRTSKEKYIENEITSFRGQNSEKPDYASSAKLRLKLTIMLAMQLNYAKNYASNNRQIKA